MARGFKEVWAARNKIFEGMKNSIFKKEHVEEIALARLAICEKCENIDREGTTCVCPGTQPCCKLCGCKLAWKARALSEGCDAELWDAILTEEEEADVNKQLGIDPNEHL